MVSPIGVFLGAAALNQTPLDWAGNLRRILAAIDEARDRGVSILCLPEMCIPGYGCEDMFFAPHVAATSLEMLAEIEPATAGLAVAVGLPIRHDGSLYNAACLIVDGRVDGFAAKQFLANDGIHYEPRWFRPWPRGTRAEIPYHGRRVPLGDLLFDVGGLVIGFEICEDAWVADRPGRELARRGANVILNPSASHFAIGKHAERIGFVREGSRDFGVAYVYANLLGNESGRAIYDGGCLIAQHGEIAAAGTRLSFRETLLTIAPVEIAGARSGTAAFEKITMPMTLPTTNRKTAAVHDSQWESSAQLDFEEFTRAEALGLWDYMRKSRSNGFVVSLSGGVDSASCACLVSFMMRLAWQELGRHDVITALKYFDAQAWASPDELLRRLLVCVYQSTHQSGPVTRAAARGVAKSVGAEYHELDVDSLVKAYVSMVETATGLRLTWEKDDLALQNIQARTRAPGVWMLANLRGALLLTTSNRSEAAVGYATMDGDTCGGLAPLAGIGKAFLRKWLKWVETDGPLGLGSIPETRAVNVQPPTAELRPGSASQTDEGDLMPYEILDAIESAAIRDRLAPVEVYRRMKIDFAQHSVRDLAAWIDRFFRLWSRSQWKRERYAPSFHLDDENLDPKTWCRFPILSGGFERELDELRRAAGADGESLR